MNPSFHQQEQAFRQQFSPVHQNNLINKHSYLEMGGACLIFVAEHRVPFA